MGGWHLLNYFKPTWMVESIYQLTPEQLRKRGVQGIVTDLDNTLIAWDNLDGTPEMAAWVATMNQANFPIIIVSNNSKKRVERVANNYNIKYFSMAQKPSRRGLRKAIRLLNVPEKNVVMIGDQLMTDVLAANRLGIRSILVKPIITSDGTLTQINRRIEQVIFKRVLIKNPELKWRKIIE